MRALHLTVSALACFAALPAVAATATWTGAVSADFATAGNWSTLRVPGAADDAIIVAAANAPVIAAAADVASVEVRAGGLLTINSTLATRRINNLVGGAIDVAAGASVSLTVGAAGAVFGDLDSNGDIVLAPNLGGLSALVDLGGAEASLGGTLQLSAGTTQGGQVILANQPATLSSLIVGGGSNNSGRYALSPSLDVDALSTVGTSNVSVTGTIRWRNTLDFNTFDIVDLDTVEANGIGTVNLAGIASQQTVARAFIVPAETSVTVVSSGDLFVGRLSVDGDLTFTLHGVRVTDGAQVFGNLRTPVLQSTGTVQIFGTSSRVGLWQVFAKSGALEADFLDWNDGAVGDLEASCDCFGNFCNEVEEFFHWQLASGDVTVDGAFRVLADDPLMSCLFDGIGEAQPTLTAQSLFAGSLDFDPGRRNETRIGNTLDLVIGGNVTVANYVFIDPLITFNNGTRATVTQLTSDFDYHGPFRFESRGLPLERTELHVPAGTGGLTFADSVRVGTLIYEPGVNGSLDFDTLDVDRISIGQAWNCTTSLRVQQSIELLPSIPFANTCPLTFDTTDTGNVFAALNQRDRFPSFVIEERDPGDRAFVDFGTSDFATDEFVTAGDVEAIGQGWAVDIGLLDIGGSLGLENVDGTSGGGAVDCTFNCVDFGGNTGFDFGVGCGNGRVDLGEVCDDGGDFYVNACSADCTAGVFDAASNLCGNGTIESIDFTETCDDGNMQSGDGCDRFCNPSAPQGCGDGNIDCPVEECDDGNFDNGDGCSAECRREQPLFLEYFGDASIDPFSALACGQWGGETNVLPVAGDTAVLVGGFTTAAPPVGVNLQLSGGGTVVIEDSVVLGDFDVDGVNVEFGGVVEVGDLRVFSAALTPSASPDDSPTLIVRGDLIVTNGGFIDNAAPVLSAPFDYDLSSKDVEGGISGDLIFGGTGEHAVFICEVGGDLTVEGSVIPVEGSNRIQGVEGPGVVVVGGALHAAALNDGEDPRTSFGVDWIVDGDLDLDGGLDQPQVRLRGGEHDVTGDDARFAAVEVGEQLATGGPVALPITIARIGAIAGLGELRVTDGVAILPDEFTVDDLIVGGGLLVGGQTVRAFNTSMFGGRFVAPALLQTDFADLNSSFVANGGRVEVNGGLSTGPGVFFANLAIVGSSTFFTNGPFVVSNGFEVPGTVDAPIALTGDSTWEFRLLDPAGVDVDFVEVANSHHLGAFFVDPAHFVDDGGNQGWVAGIAASCGNLRARVGDVSLLSDADVAAFVDDAVGCVDGDLIIGTDVTGAVISGLSIVTGEVRVVDTAATTVELVSLTRAGAITITDNDALTLVDLRNLDTVEGDLTITGNPNLAEINLSSLSRVGGNLVIRDVDADAIDLSELDLVGGDFDASDNAALTDLRVGTRAIGGDLTIDNNDSLQTLTLVVVSVGGTVSIEGNAALLQIVLGLLNRVQGDVSIVDNDALELASLPSLTTVGGNLTIEADTIEVADLESAASTTLIGANLDIPDDVTCDDAGTCSPIALPDVDGDGVIDDDDNCGSVANADQVDSDGDRAGDACDNDDDDDGLADSDDEDPVVATAVEGDRDGDGIADADDNCADDANAAQGDVDGDGTGDACDGDDDNDGVDDAEDACPLTTASGCFDDVDGDGTANADDPCPTLVGGDVDGDDDGLGDGCDADVDGDGVVERVDVCPGKSDDQADEDSDGAGDACDRCPGLAGPVAGCPVVDGTAPDRNLVPEPEEPAADGGCGCNGNGASPSSLIGLALLGLVLRRKKSLAALSLLVAVQASAATYTWTGAVDAFWSVDGNWDLAGAPGVGDSAIINTADAVARLDVNVDVASIAVSDGALLLEQRFLRVDAFDITGGVVIADGSDIDVGAFTLDGGVLSAPSSLVVSTSLVINGGFVDTNSSVIIDGDAVSVDIRNAVLGRFVATRGGSVVDIARGSSLIVSDFEVGSVGNAVTLRGAGAGTDRWVLDVRGSVIVDDVNVADSDNRGFLISPQVFVDGGNNIGWGLPPSLCGGLATLEGTVVLLDDQDVADFNALGVQCLIGDIVVGGDISDVAIDQVQVLLGRMLVRSTGVATVSAPVLNTANGIELIDDPALESFSAPLLEDIGTDLIFDQDAIALIELPVLSHVGGDLRMSDNDQLVDVDLDLSQGIGGDLVIDDNDGLRTWRADVPSCGGDLSVTSNDVLETLSLPQLTSVGGDLSIVDNDALTSVDMPNWQTCGGDLVVSDNASLPNLLFELLQNVPGDVIIVNNSLLRTLALGLSTIGGDLKIVDNGVLLTLTLADLASIGGDFEFRGNLSILILDLPLLASVGGDLVVEDNAALQTYRTPVLASVGGNLVIDDNPDLLSCDLHSLSTCGGNLVITDNDDGNVADLSAIVSVGGDLTCEGDPVLPPGVQCLVDGTCGPIFGDGLIVLFERCDDENVTDGDGCGQGRFERGFVCNTIAPTRCDADRDDDLVIDLLDRCVGDSDGTQDNTDGDARGDACDDDDDNDGVIDGADTCPRVANATQLRDCGAAAPDDDADNDGVVDADDDCADVADAAQADADDDGTGDACDDDDDGDGTDDAADPCPLRADVNSAVDCAADADGDGRNDVDDACPEVASDEDADLDGDGLGDACDSDDDDDGVSDARDGCAKDADPDQADVDNDGFGDVCDRCPGVDDNAADTECGDINAEPDEKTGCQATPTTPTLALLGLLLLRRRRRG